MEIGGLQPVTLLDYPQKVAAIIFTQGCNMRCPFCYNPNLVLTESVKIPTFNYREVLKFLKKRKKYLDAVVVTGGEPTVQPDLLKFLSRMKKIGYLIKLDTNGLNSRLLEKIISDRLADYLAMDIKGPFNDYGRFCGVDVLPENIIRSVALIKKSGLNYEFRSTLVKGLHSKKDILQMAADLGRVKKYFLQDFSPAERLVGQDFTGRKFSRKEKEEILKLVSDKVGDCQWR